MKHIILIFSIAILLFSCSKEEGVGGKNTITGVVMVQERHELSDVIVAEYPATEDRVYIVYGEDSYYSDEARTNYDGSYRFEYLYGGSYSVFAYSECKICDAGTVPIIIPAELSGKKDEVVLDTIFAIKYVD
ncbi:MAG: hypothetical protein ACPG4Z_01545 [Chitinophagales bacterium]